MQTTFAVLLLSFAAILVGLLFAALPYLKDPEPDRPAPLWVISIGIYAISLLIFSWLTIHVEDLSKPKFAISTLANLAFFVAASLQAAFYRSLNKSRNQIAVGKWLPIAAVIYSAIFEWARQGTLDDRIIAVSSMGLIAIGWQIYELKELRRSESGTNISYLYWVAILEAACGCGRLILSVINTNTITHFSTIPTGHLIFVILQVILTILSFIGVSKFWTEKISILRISEREESEKIKLLISEKEKLLLKLMSSNKTSASGVLSATVIHEITQPLTALTLNISNALRSLTSEEYVLLRSQIFQCKDSAERISEIIQMIRSIFASETLQAGESDLGEVANSVYNYAITDCRESGIEFNLELQTGVTTTANFREVQHIVLNLIINSIQNLQLQDRYKKALTIRVWREATQAKLSVADNGGGIPEEFRTSLFSLLDTTKKDGMGVGLWLCKQIAERNKGSITYYPNGHQGSIFEICFPLVSEIEYTSKIKIQ